MKHYVTCIRRAWLIDTLAYDFFLLYSSAACNRRSQCYASTDVRKKNHARAVILRPCETLAKSMLFIWCTKSADWLQHTTHAWIYILFYSHSWYAHVCYVHYMRYYNIKTWRRKNRLFMYSNGLSDVETHIPANLHSHKRIHTFEHKLIA